MKLVRAETEIVNNHADILAYCREDGKRVVHRIKDFKPYLYVPYGERDKISTLEHEDKVYKSIDGIELAKVYTPLPSDVRTVRDTYSNHWEADIQFPLRYMVDECDVLEPCNPSVMFIDIETDSSGRVPNPQDAIEMILCVTALSNDIFTTFVWREDVSTGVATRVLHGCLHEINYFSNEPEMLDAFLKFTRTDEPDIISGWNVMQFDLNYIINRARRLGVDYSVMSPQGKVFIDDKHFDVFIRGVAVIDLLNAYKKFSQWTSGMKESYKLDFIGREVAGVGKTGNGANSKWMWKYQLDQLIDYNANDCYVCAMINEKQQLLDFLDELRRLCHCQLEDCLTMTRMADCYVLTLFHERLVFPSKSKHEKYSFEGAIVASWASGIHENVAVFDIKSLYPSIIVSANLSPETMRDDREPNTIQLSKYSIRQDIKGYLPEVIRHLFEERGRYKKLRATVDYGTDAYKFYNLRQEALKRLLNSLYGQTAYPNSRLYDARVAETITWVGRELIMWSKRFLESIDHTVNYIDTDGLHCPFPDVDIPKIQGVLDQLNESYNEFCAQYGITNHIFIMEFEKVYKKIFYGKDTKKRYAGALCYKDGKDIDVLEVLGFEIKRSDASQFTRIMQERVFNMLLREEHTKDEILRYIGEQIDRMRKGKVKFEELGIPKGMSKMPREYIRGEIDEKLPIWRQKGITAGIRGALYSEEALGLEISSKPKLIYVSKMPEGLEPVDVLCFDEESQIPAGVELNIELMLEKCVKAKLDPIFKGIGWKLSSLIPWWRGKPTKGKEHTMQMFELDDYKVKKPTT